MKDWDEMPEAAGPQSEGAINNVQYGDPGYPSIGRPRPGSLPSRWSASGLRLTGSGRSGSGWRLPPPRSASPRWRAGRWLTRYSRKPQPPLRRRHPGDRLRGCPDADELRHRDPALQTAVAQEGAADGVEIEYQGRQLHFTRPYLQGLADAFRDKAYDAVSFQLADAANSHTNDPERHRGTITGMTVESDGLYITLQPY